MLSLFSFYAGVCREEEEDSVMRWIDRQDEPERLARWDVLNRVLSRLVLAVWLAVLGYSVALVWFLV